MDHIKESKLKNPMESRIPGNTGTQTAPSEQQMEEIQNVLKRAQDLATEKAKEVDRAVHQYPYQSIGIAFGIGILVGILASRR
jgi:ElaB/YqjD/DUF883 family membrane-anchored ribosome-binding protein